VKFQVYDGSTSRVKETETCDMTELRKSCKDLGLGMKGGKGDRNLYLKGIKVKQCPDSEKSVSSVSS
jgi:hypothetical protein